MVLTYDQLKDDKLKVIKNCYSFLNVDDSFIPLASINDRPQKVNYSLLRTWLLRKKNKHQFVYNKSMTRLFIKNQSDWDKLMCRNINRIDKYLIQKIASSKKPSFNSSIKSRLIELFKSDIDKLEMMVNIDLSSWKG